MNLAVDLAEQQLRDGTASAQVITHYLKLAATREKDRLEREMMEEQTKLLKAKTDAIESSQRSEAMYSDVLEAMKRYGGHFNQSRDESELY